MKPDFQTVAPPRLALGAFPTPLDDAPRLATALGLAGLRVKREDLAGPALGGNKIRKLELLLADARAKGCDAVISTAGQQSNFCRALAGTAAKLGMGCALLLRGAKPNRAQGNVLLDQLFGADLRFIDVTDPWDPRVGTALDALAAELRARGRTPYVAHLVGSSAGLGVAAWAAGAEELVAQFEEAGIDPDRLIVACGSGLTLAGLALGLKRAGRRCRPTGISAQQKAAPHDPVDRRGRCGRRRPAGRRAAPRGRRFRLHRRVRRRSVRRAEPASLAAVRLAASCEGLVLDPVYTGKAMAGLKACVADGRVGRHETVVFLHSGGLPGLFVNSDAFAQSA